MQAPPRRLVNASVLTATLRRASRIAVASKLTVSQLYLSQRSQATAATKGETKKFTTSRSHKYLRFGCSPVSHAPAAIGALCLGKSLLRSFVLFLFNFQRHSMVVVKKGAILFDCLPLLQWMVTG